MNRLWMIIFVAGAGFSQAVPEEPAGPAPVFSIEANGSCAPTLYRGWPLMVRASILHPATGLGEGEPGALAVSGWGVGIQLTVRNAQGEAQSWPFALLKSPPAELQLEPGTVAEVVWRLTPEQTAGIPAGNYEIAGLADTLAAVPVPVRVEAEPSTLTLEQEAAKQELLYHYHRLNDDPASAMEAVDELLRSQPYHPGALGLKGFLLADQGDDLKALEFIGNAIAEVERLNPGQNPDQDEPPVELLKRYAEVSRRAAQRQKAQPAAAKRR